MTLARYAWGVLAYNVLVILWGAYVRASGSGAGCGSHWPLCNGAVVPREATIATLVEYSHRLTSGLALISVVVLLAWVWRKLPSGHPARTGAVLTFLFMLLEAGIGAGLVLFELVADNATMARALFMAVHLVNTFVLLGCVTLTAWWISGGTRLSLAGVPLRASLLALGCIGLILVGASGAVAALGDTLFPNQSLAEALQADLSPTSHLLIRLRLLHPAISVVVAIGLMVGAPRLARAAGHDRARTLGSAVAGLAAVQIALGAINVALLAPVWMQMVHLLVADALWITFVLFAAHVIAEPERARAARAAELHGAKLRITNYQTRPPITDH